MVPGKMRLCVESPCASWAIATVGSAWALVHCASSCLPWARLTMPLVAIAPATARPNRPAAASRRGRGNRGVLLEGEDMLSPLVFVWPGGGTGVDEAEHRRHEEQGRAGGEQQPADDRATERRVLTRLDRHRRH